MEDWDYPGTIDVGARLDKLEDSVAFEIGLGAEREAQLYFNSELVRKAGGLLAPATGTERFLTVGGGHTTAFCRARPRAR